MVVRARTGWFAGGHSASDKPWGELFSEDFKLEGPLEYIKFESQTNRQVVWQLGVMSRGEVQSFLATNGLTPSQAAEALASSSFSANGSISVIKPTDSLVLSLAPATRANLYSRLARMAGNPAKSIPTICAPAMVSEIIKGTAMSPAVAEAFKKLVYNANGVSCFSDQEVMLRQLSSSEQRDRFMQSILRQKAVMVRLQVRRDSDVDKLLGYWAAPANGVHYKDMRPLLDSLKRTPDGGGLSILYLLPPFARERLNTFPMITAGGANKPDCHWGTFNFFNNPPDDRFYDSAYLNKYLQENYYQVASPSMYGDVILLLDENNTLVHSAVQIADDIVFTKTGAAYEQPWTMMRLNDLMAIYAATPNIRLSVWRNDTM
jgi:hypothetical protein